MMMKPETKDLLAQLGSTSYGKALQDYLEVSLTEIGDITKPNTWEETLGRRFAVKLIRDLFALMLKKENTVAKKSSYE